MPYQDYCLLGPFRNIFGNQFFFCYPDLNQASRDNGIFVFAILTQMRQAGVGKQAGRQASKQASNQAPNHPTTQQGKQASNQAGKQASKQATKAPGQDSKKKKPLAQPRYFFRCYPDLGAHSWETPHPASQAMGRPSSPAAAWKAEG